jgi:hypothetical protein
MVTVTADFVFNRWNLDVLPYSVHTMVRPLSRAEPSTGMSEYFYVGRGCGSPELHSEGPDWFEYSFVDEHFVVYREF